MYKSKFRKLNRGWVRIGPSLPEAGTELKVWTEFRSHLVSDHQRLLFDMWLEKCDGHRLPERHDFSPREILPMIQTFYVLECDGATGNETHRFIGTAYTEAFGHEIKPGDPGQPHFDKLEYSAADQESVLRDIYERGCPCLERYQFLNFEKPHQGCIELTLPVRRDHSDDLGEAVGVGFLYDSESAPP